MMTAPYFVIAIAIVLLLGFAALTLVFKRIKKSSLEPVSAEVRSSLESFDDAVSQKALHYLGIGDIESALATLQDDIARERNQVAQALRRYAWNAAETDVKGAIDAYTKVLELVPDDHLAQAELADLYVRDGQLDQASTLLYALIKAPELRERTRIAAKAQLSTLETLNGRSEIALQHLEEAAHGAKALGRDKLTPDVLIKLAKAARTHGMRERAANAYDDVLKLSKGRPSAALAEAQNGLGALALTDDAERARAHFEQALEVSRKLNSPAGVVAGLRNLGAVSLARHDYPAALAYFMRALHGFDEIGDKLGAGETLVSIGRLLSIENNLDDARRAFSDATERLMQAGPLGRELLLEAQQLSSSSNPSHTSPG